LQFLRRKWRTEIKYEERDPEIPSHGVEENENVPLKFPLSSFHFQIVYFAGKKTMKIILIGKWEQEEEEVLLTM
jgi:hypothetical protein